MQEYTVKNLSEYLNIVNEIKDNWKANELWFRGVNDSRYKLIPSLYRGNFKIHLEEEKEFKVDFIRKAKAYVTDYHKLKTIDWYILMQHYGFPTRLIDWTSGSFIALFFAVRNIFKNTDRVVYIIDPFYINKKFHIIDIIPCPDEHAKEELILINDYLPNDKLPDFPIAIEPTYFDKRIVAQKSCFTIHGRNRDSLDNILIKNSIQIARIKISGLHVISIKEELDLAGISESTFFPDLEGLGREMIFKYVIE